jgi:hypothetical protein
MAATPFSSRLRYLDADDLDDSTVDFSTLDVHGSDDRDLGDLDGFIVDSQSGRVVYAVVDSGGWFRSRHFAVPIGHAQLDNGRRRLNVNVTRAAAAGEIRGRRFEVRGARAHKAVALHEPQRDGRHWLARIHPESTAALEWTSQALRARTADRRASPLET